MKPLLSLQLETEGFAGAWEHCDGIANWIAQAASHERADSFLYANLLSTVLNELLELVFARHAGRGQVKCQLSRDGAWDRLELTVPVDDGARAFWHRSVAAARSAGVRELYTRALLDREPGELSLGLLELAADYGARLSIADSPDEQEIRLGIGIAFEETGIASATPAAAP